MGCGGSSDDQGESRPPAGIQNTAHCRLRRKLNAKLGTLLRKKNQPLSVNIASMLPER
jgi:hypothetical protein